MMNITEPTITESLIETDTNHYTATLDLYPLSASYDNGEYKCTVLVTADTVGDYTTNIINETSTDVVVEGEYIIGETSAKFIILVSIFIKYNTQILILTTIMNFQIIKSSFIFNSFCSIIFSLLSHLSLSLLCRSS